MKTVPIDASLRKIVSVQRNNLQRKSLLKNLNGGGHWGDFSHKMIIPGGMNFKEKAYYNLTKSSRSNRNTNTSSIVKSIQKGVSKNEKQQSSKFRRKK